MNSTDADIKNHSVKSTRTKPSTEEFMSQSEARNGQEEGKSFCASPANASEAKIQKCFCFVGRFSSTDSRDSKRDVNGFRGFFFVRPTRGSLRAEISFAPLDGRRRHHEGKRDMACFFARSWFSRLRFACSFFKINLCPSCFKKTDFSPALLSSRGKVARRRLHFFLSRSMAARTFFSLIYFLSTPLGATADGVSEIFL